MILTRSPLRIPLGGGGTDFPLFYETYGGYILGFAIQKYVYVVLHPTQDEKYHLKYSKNECVDKLDQLENRVAAEVLRHYEVKPGLEICTFSDVPESSGLGGSSAFCVSLVLAVRKLLGLSEEKSEIFSESYHIERFEASQPGGFQDQFFSTYGNAHEMEFSTVFSGSKVVNDKILPLLPLLKLVHASSGGRRLDIAKNQNTRVKQDESQMVDGLLLVKDIGKEIGKAIDQGNYNSVGRLFNRHWLAKKSRDANISTSEVDSLYSKGLELGAEGGKLIGMGGGGYVLFCGGGLDGQLPTIDLKLDTEGTKVLHCSN